MTRSGYGYVCQSGETFDSVALVIYGDEKYAAELLDANPEHCGKLIFEGDEILRLPVVEVPDEEPNDYAAVKAPWKD